ncbi:MAG: hypothetical protein ABI895_34135, partial [Deltaproteobacteria bacterium]
RRPTSALWLSPSWLPSQLREPGSASAFPGGPDATVPEEGLARLEVVTAGGARFLLSTLA